MHLAPLQQQKVVLIMIYFGNKMDAHMYAFAESRIFWCLTKFVKVAVKFISDNLTNLNWLKTTSQAWKLESNCKLTTNTVKAFLQLVYDGSTCRLPMCVSNQNVQETWTQQKTHPWCLKY